MRAQDALSFEFASPRCEAFRHSVGYHGFWQWNNLDVDSRNIGSFVEFKKSQNRAMLIPLEHLV